MLSTESIAPVAPFRVLRSVYHRAAEQGMFDGKRVQLIRGMVIDMSPMGTPHARALVRLTKALAGSIPDELDLRVQLPMAATDDSEPEPDFAIVRSETTLDDDHPSTAVLVVEVADSSLKLDLGPKAGLYASCKVPEYWVVDLFGETTVVHRQPKKSGYESVRRTAWSRTLSSSAIPQLSLRLADLLTKG